MSTYKFNWVICHILVIMMASRLVIRSGKYSIPQIRSFVNVGDKVPLNYVKGLKVKLVWCPLPLFDLLCCSFFAPVFHLDAPPILIKEDSEYPEWVFNLTKPVCPMQRFFCCCLWFVSHHYANVWISSLTTVSLQFICLVYYLPPTPFFSAPLIRNSPSFSFFFVL